MNNEKIPRVASSTLAQRLDEEQIEFVEKRIFLLFFVVPSIGHFNETTLIIDNLERQIPLMRMTQSERSPEEISSLVICSPDTFAKNSIWNGSIDQNECFSTSIFISICSNQFASSSHAPLICCFFFFVSLQFPASFLRPFAADRYQFQCVNWTNHQHISGELPIGNSVCLSRSRHPDKLDSFDWSGDGPRRWGRRRRRETDLDVNRSSNERERTHFRVVASLLLSAMYDYYSSSSQLRRRNA